MTPRRGGQEPIFHMRYDTVIFDLDGTLLDTIEDLAASVNFVMDEFGFPNRSVDEVRSFVGNGILNLVALCIPGGRDNPQLMQAFELYKKHYAEHCLEKTVPYPGIPELVAGLKAEGRSLAVVSNKFDIGTQALMEKNFPGVFDFVMGETPGVERKPAPDSVRLAMAALGARDETTVYVGDSEVDIKTAANSGLACISVTWGFRPREELERLNPYRLADTPEQLRDML